jgi:F-type H+-transporting ATPase subunit b
MDLNITLVSELVVFLVFLIIVKKKIWPLFIEILNDRQREIEKGLEASKISQESLRQTHKKNKEMIAEVKQQCSDMIEAATKRADAIEEKAKEKAELLIQQAKKRIEDEKQQSQTLFLKEAKSHYSSILKQTLLKLYEKTENREQISSSLMNELSLESE